MIHVLFLSDKAVKQRLFELALESEKPVLLSQTRHGPAMRPVVEREPFASLERAFGRKLDQVVVADEGGVDGMWRDPVGDLADRLFPSDRAKAYVVTSHYVLLLHGQPRAFVKKREVSEDAWWIQEACHIAGIPVGAPDPRKKPGDTQRAGPKSAPPKGAPSRGTPPRAPKPSTAAAPETSDPWALLGIAPGMGKAEARKAFRRLVAQYHPDKLAHLAPEFRALAEERTRQLLAAWSEVESELG